MPVLVGCILPRFRRSGGLVGDSSQFTIRLSVGGFINFTVIFVRGYLRIKSMGALQRPFLEPGREGDHDN